jgi:hypothetical protein
MQLFPSQQPRHVAGSQVQLPNTHFSPVGHSVPPAPHAHAAFEQRSLPPSRQSVHAPSFAPQYGQPFFSHAEPKQQPCPLHLHFSHTFAGGPHGSLARSTEQAAHVPPSPQVLNDGKGDDLRHAFVAESQQPPWHSVASQMHLPWLHTWS